MNYSFLNTSSSVDVNQKRPTLRADPYALTGSTGVLITEERFLEAKFGALKYAALSDAPKDYGVYLTDYFADAYLVNHPTVTSYGQLLGLSQQFTGYVYGYVNGVIDTGYKDRYRDLLAKLSDPAMSKAELKKLSESDECLVFLDELCQYLSVAYSFEPDFVENAVASGTRQFVSTGISTFTYRGRTCDYSESWFSSDDMRNSVPLGENEILMNYDVYNQIFGTNYTPQNMGTFKPHEVKFSYYLQCDQNKSQKKYEATLNIVGLNNNAVRVNMADNVYREIQRAEMITFGYYFENAEQAELLFNIAEENGFIPNSSIAGSITTMTKAVKVFSRFFDLIFGVLCAALLLLMVQFELKNIRDKIRDIGIMKALGARDLDLIVIFGFQVLVAGFAMVVLYLIGSFVFIGLANEVLVLSLNELAKNAMVLNVSFLVVEWKYILQNCVLACIIMIVSFLVPMLRLRYIKPTNVIKAKE